MKGKTSWALLKDQNHSFAARNWTVRLCLYFCHQRILMFNFTLHKHTVMRITCMHSTFVTYSFALDQSKYMHLLKPWQRIAAVN